MQLDHDRIMKYLNDMVAEVEDIQALLLAHSDDELLAQSHYIKALKYSTIVVAESMANVLLHVLAKEHNVVIRGFTEVFMKARDLQVMPADLIDRLLPFARFRNMLVHQYWRVQDRVFLANLRNGLEDFRAFANLTKKIVDASEGRDDHAVPR
jgi:uncharacterized protein YutE (UPF0331/DUF86 family)